MWRRLLREPLVRFLAAGLLIFAVSGIFGGGQADESDRIVIDEDRLTQLRGTFENQWRRPPTADELAGLIDGFAREEALYREGRRMGLDEDDTIIRRRVAQKLTFLVEDLVVVPEPSEADLAAYLESQPDRFVRPGRVSFSQLYFSESRRGESAERDAETTLAALSDGGSAEGGDPFLLGADYADVTRDDVEADFGPAFAGAAFAAPVGEWSGPVRSAYGVHLLRVEKRSESVHPALEQVRSEVASAWRDERQRQANEEAVARIVERYDVVVEDGPGEGEEP